MPDKITAPFTIAQVDALNRFQRAGHVHPFTCGNDHSGDKDLVATKDGWICPNCDYRQDWAHAAMAGELPPHPFPPGETFQLRVLAWMMECFSMEVCRDRQERNHRFLEEALELVQSLGCTRSEAHQLVDYTFDRPAGDPNQELGGVMVTIAALCFPSELHMSVAAETELARVWSKIDVIRAKQAAKPKHSPIPEHRL